MIRRGLQFCFLWAALGAAPSFASLYDHYPESMTFTGFPVQTDGMNPNGFYVRTTFLTSGSTLEFMNFAADGTTVKLQMVYQSNGGITFYLGPNPSAASGRLYTKQLVGWGNNPLPDTISAWNSGTGLAAPNAYAVPHTVSDQFAANFPDWERGSTLIPLGFGFGMVFWATCLAFHVPMRWVRQLADAAS